MARLDTTFYIAADDGDDANSDVFIGHAGVDPAAPFAAIAFGRFTIRTAHGTPAEALPAVLRQLAGRAERALAQQQGSGIVRRVVEALDLVAAAAGVVAEAEQGRHEGEDGTGTEAPTTAAPVPAGGDNKHELCTCEDHAHHTDYVGGDHSGHCIECGCLWPATDISSRGNKGDGGEAAERVAVDNDVDHGDPGQRRPGAGPATPPLAPAAQALADLIDREWIASCLRRTKENPGAPAARAMADPMNAAIVGAAAIEAGVFTQATDDRGTLLWLVDGDIAAVGAHETGAFATPAEALYVRGAGQ